MPLSIEKPTVQDLPTDHPFLCAQDTRDDYYPDTRALNNLYESYPEMHPANAVDYGLLEVLPPYTHTYRQIGEAYRDNRGIRAVPAAYM